MKTILRPPNPALIDTISFHPFTKANHLGQVASGVIRFNSKERYCVKSGPAPDLIGAGGRSGAPFKKCPAAAPSTVGYKL